MSESSKLQRFSLKHLFKPSLTLLNIDLSLTGTLWLLCTLDMFLELFEVGKSLITAFSPVFFEMITNLNQFCTFKLSFNIFSINFSLEIIKNLVKIESKIGNNISFASKHTTLLSTLNHTAAA